MPHAAFIQLDTRLVASRYRLVSWLALVIALAFMIAVLPLPVSYRVGLVVVLLVCLVLSQLLSMQLLVLSSMPSKATNRLNKQSTQIVTSFNELDWQLQVAQGYISVPREQTNAKADVWQAKLVHITRYGAVMRLQFAVYEPMPRHLSLILWQDQVDTDSWRQLSSLANVST